MRQTLVQLLNEAGTHPVSIENLCAKGTPDLNCTLGWMELKAVRKWPKREKLTISCLGKTERVTTQLIWLRKRDRAGGGAWLVANVEEAYLIFRGENAYDIFARGDGATKDELLGGLADEVIRGKPSSVEFVKALQRA